MCTLSDEQINKLPEDLRNELVRYGFRKVKNKIDSGKIFNGLVLKLWYRTLKYLDINSLEK